MPSPLGWPEVPCGDCGRRVPDIDFNERCPDCATRRKRRVALVARRFALLGAAVAATLSLRHQATSPEGQWYAVAAIPVVAVVDTNDDPSLVEYAIPGNDDAIRAVQLYARAAADAVLEGKAAAPIQARGDDSEFVELDAEGNPVAKDDEGRRARRPAPKKAAQKPAAQVANVPPPGNDDKAGLARAEAEVAENEATDEDAAQ